jgi:Rieske Fe-S protein
MSGAAVPPPERPHHAAGELPAAPPRRTFLCGMLAGSVFVSLAACYGTFFAWAGRFLFPRRRQEAWLFVRPTAQIAPGESLTYESPTGVRVVIKRAATASGESGAALEQFIALSSVCPHLGCRVHWEGQNNRFFCPCHNGAFDPEGRATAGPPLAAHQQLPRYALKLERELLYIQMPSESLGTGNRALSELGRPA